MDSALVKELFAGLSRDHFYDALYLIDPSSRRILGSLTENQAVSHCLAHCTIFRQCLCQGAVNDGKSIHQITHTSDDHLFFITSCPVVVENQALVLQVVKDITHSSFIDIAPTRNLELVQLFGDGSQVILKDALTEIRNEAEVRDQLPRTIGQSMAEDRRLTLFTFYLSNLQLLIEIHGHAAGDLIIAEFMGILRAYAHRRKGWSGRSCGMTFVLLLFDLDDATLHQICRHIHEKFRDLPVLEKYREIDLSVRIGYQSIRNEVMSPEELVQSAVKNSLYFPEKDLENLVIPIREVLGEFLLTQREQDVALMILHGFSNQEIAAKFHVSTPTIKKHASMVYRKLQVKNRVDLMAKFHS